MSTAFGSATFPKLSAFGYSGELVLTSSGAGTFPSLGQLYSVGGYGYITDTEGVADLPILIGIGYSGPSASAELPLLQSAGVAYVQSLVSADINLPHLKGLGIGVHAAVGVGSGTFKLPVLTGGGYYLSLASGAATLPMLTPGAYALLSVFSTLVMNTRHFAVSEYTNFNFNSYCEFPKGRFLGLSPSGLCTLFDATTDDGDDIPTILELGTTDFGEENKKSCVDAVLNYRGDGTMILETRVDEPVAPDVAEIVGAGDGKLRNYKFKMSRFRTGKNWQFTLKNKNGSAFDPSEFAVFYDVLSRRV